MNTYVLGIACYFHDSSVCLIKNGKIISAVQEERFTGIKNDSSFPQRSIEWCLNENNISTKDLELIVFYEKPLKKFLRVINSSIEQFPRSRKYFVSQMGRWLSEKMWTKTNISKKLDVDLKKIIFCQHHLSHASSIYYNSNLSDATIMVSDGVGEDQSFSIWKGDNDTITPLYEIKYPNSLGLFYSTMTSFLGHSVNNGENKVMSMAAYGNDEYYDKILKVIKKDDELLFKQDFKYFNYHHSLTDSYSDNLIQLLGRPRNSEESFLNSDGNLANNEAKRFANIAFGTQKITEEIIKKKCELSFKLNSSKNLCITGGVHLNCVANYKVFKDSKFENIFSNNCSSDSGGSVGAALWAWKRQISKNKIYASGNFFTGPAYTSSNIEEALKNLKYSYKKYEKFEEIVQEGAQDLEDGKIVAWFQGRMEFGKRSLGNRSILARPDRKDLAKKINLEVKMRETYQPFAASILSESVNTFFHKIDKFDYSYRYMNVIAEARVEKIKYLKGVLHIDKSSRIHSVYEKDNELFFKLLKSFEKKTRIPLLLNTSFNLKGEPIVDNPIKALSTFFRSKCDIMYIDKFKIINDL